MYDIRFSNARKTVLYIRFNEWWRPTLSLVATWSLPREGGALLCSRGYTGAGTYAQSLRRLQRFKGKLAMSPIVRLMS